MPGYIQTISDTVEADSAYNNRGLFTTIGRRKGNVLCRLGGEILQHNDDLALLGSAEWNALDDERILLRRERTSYYLINHSTTPNLTIDPATFDLSAKVDIARGDELLLDYLENGFPQTYLNSERCAYLR